MKPRTALTTLLDSQVWRRVSGSPLGNQVLKSRVYERIDMNRRVIEAEFACLVNPRRFEQVDCLLLFIGHTKSGGSLVGALLDAHPNAVVADETDVLHLVERGLKRHQIFDILVRGALREARKDRVTARRLEPYSLSTPGLWQGRHAGIQVIGDSRAGRTTRRLADDPRSSVRLHDMLDGLPVRFIHVVRRPIDPISAMMLRSGRSADSAILDYFEQCSRLAKIRSWSGLDITTVHYEQLLEDPSGVVRALCAWLGIPVRSDHLAAAQVLIDPSRQPESSRLRWTAGDLQRVRGLTERYDFLSRYADVG